MPMSPRLLRPIASGVHPDAAAWRSAVVANGGSVSASTVKAVSTFCAAIDAAGIRDKFYRLNLFAGDSDASLVAVRTPLYRGPSRTGTQYGNALDTNNNFVQGDYSESVGLTGNATSKYLDTGFSADILPDMAHIGFYKPNTNAPPASDRPIGAYDTSLSPAGIFGLRSDNSGNFTPEVRRVGAGALIAATSGGLLVVDRDAEDSLTTYDDGVSAATNSLDATGHPMPEEAVFVFNQNQNGSPVGTGYYDETIAGYTIGASMSAAQHTAFAAAMTAFQTAMGRNPHLPPSYADSDVNTFINAVEAADGETLEYAVRDAYNDFITGCKSDGIWDAIKASCILAGARTLAGALVPLVGTAPTNNNFAEADYNRETGLVGDGSTTSLNTNRDNNADPQNDNHNALYITAANTNDPAVYMGSDGSGSAGFNQLTIASGAGAGTLVSASRNGALVSDVVAGGGNQLGFHGSSRSSSSEYVVRVLGANTTHFRASVSPTSSDVHVFARGPTPAVFTDARIAFYSIGESLDLAALDTRVSALITAIGNAI